MSAFDIRADAAKPLTPERERQAREWALDYLDKYPLLDRDSEPIHANNQAWARDVLRFGAALDEARNGSPALAAASREARP